MVAFLKRRWILLTSAYVISLFSVVGLLDFEFEVPAGRRFYLSVSFFDRGGFLFSPRYYANGEYEEIRIPVWLPPAAILGWIVIRELRWREKRAKEQNTA